METVGLGPMRAKHEELLIRHYIFHRGSNTLGMKAKYSLL